MRIGHRNLKVATWSRIPTAHTYGTHTIVFSVPEYIQRHVKLKKPVCRAKSRPAFFFN